MARSSEIPAYDFFHPAIFDYIARRSPEAASWVDRYRCSGAAEIEAKSVRALLLLRGRQLDEGRLALAAAEEMLDGVRGLDALAGLIATRWISSVAAYLSYLEGDYERAASQLSQAGQAIAAAVDREELLLPFVHHCADFIAQRARMARDRRDWLEMRRQLDLLQAVNEGSEPLCELPGGRRVYFPELTAYYLSLPLTDQDHFLLRGLLDSELRRFMVIRAVRLLYARSNPAIDS